MSEEMRHISRLPAYVSVFRGVYNNTIASTKTTQLRCIHEDLEHTSETNSHDIVNSSVSENVTEPKFIEHEAHTQEHFSNTKPMSWANSQAVLLTIPPLESPSPISHIVRSALPERAINNKENEVHGSNIINNKCNSTTEDYANTLPNLEQHNKHNNYDDDNFNHDDEGVDECYERALQILNSMIAHASQRSVDNIIITKRLIHALDLESAMKKMKYVHIAGTKGKGTTAVYTSALLEGYGYRVGLFTSPHLMDVRERFLVNNRILSRSTFATYFFALYDKWQGLQNSESEMTRYAAANFNYFRFLFLLSLYIFNAEQVEIAVMEVGIGGRIDATNVIPSTVSVITALGYDHLEVLGSTIELIAQEKAGIIKPHVPCFASPQKDHPEIREIITRVANASPTQLLFLDKEIFPFMAWPTLAIGGEHAIEDSKLAFLAARYVASIPVATPLTGREKDVLTSLTFTGRSQIYSLLYKKQNITFYLDGAHTPESLSRAVAWFVSFSSSSSSLEKKQANVLLFYTSRDPHVVLKAFAPYSSLFCKAVITQIRNPRVISTNNSNNNNHTELNNSVKENGISLSENSNKIDDVSTVKKLAILTEKCMTQTIQAWQNLYPDIFCVACAHPLTSLEQLLDFVLHPITNSTAGNVDLHTPSTNIFVCGSFYLLGDVLHIIREYEKKRC